MQASAHRSHQFTPRSTTNSIRSAISLLAKSTDKDEPLHWPSGASSRPNGRMDLHALRHKEMARRYSYNPGQCKQILHHIRRAISKKSHVTNAITATLSIAPLIASSRTSSHGTCCENVIRSRRACWRHLGALYIAMDRDGSLLLFPRLALAGTSPSGRARFGQSIALTDTTAGE